MPTAAVDVVMPLRGKEETRRRELAPRKRKKRAQKYIISELWTVTVALRIRIRMRHHADARKPSQGMRPPRKGPSFCMQSTAACQLDAYA